MNHRILSAAALCILAACAAPVERPAAPQPEPPRARAALATVRVSNLSAERLTVLYRGAGQDNEVAIGTVPPNSSAELAPVPAGEPIVLIARTAAGAELALAARSFDLDGDWTWHIPRDARFVPRRQDDR